MVRSYSGAHIVVVFYDISKSTVADIWKDQENTGAMLAQVNARPLLKDDVLYENLIFLKLTRLAMSGSCNNTQKELQIQGQFYKRRPCNSTASFILNQTRFVLKAVQVGMPNLSLVMA